MIKRNILFGFLFFANLIANAQDVQTATQYIEKYKDIAIREMKRMGVPAAITLAQGILESESGNSELVKKSNNHFGIKCKSTWTSTGVTHDDDATGECFRQYASAEESYRDHSNFLRGSERYATLFKLNVKDYQAWAYGLKNAGYATNPNYPQILIKNIEQYNLQQFTLVGADEVPQFESSKYQDDKEEIDTIAVKEIDKTNQSEKNKQSTLDFNDNVIKVNGSKCIYASKGNSMLVIATKNNIALNKLLGFNELAEDGILAKNQYVFLEKKAKTGLTNSYTVNDGETLYDIAQKNGIQLQYLLDYNHLSGNEMLSPGTVINLTPISTLSNSNLPNTKIKIHIVAAKDTLYSISKKYKISVEQLKKWNVLKNERLTIGQKLIVSK